MLEVTIGKTEVYDEAISEFVMTDGYPLKLEHSLLSLSKWESKWELPFMSSDKTTEQTVDYIKCMTISPDVPDEVYEMLTTEDVNKINDYIGSKQTATWFADTPVRPGSPAAKEIITAEIIYYWMVTLNIPLDFENRHLNKLMTLIKVVNKKNEPVDKKRKRPDASSIASRKAMNEARKAQTNSNG